MTETSNMESPPKNKRPDSTLDDAVLDKIRCEMKYSGQPVINVQKIKSRKIVMQKEQKTRVEILNDYFSTQITKDDFNDKNKEKDSKKPLFCNEMIQTKFLICKKTVPTYFYTRPPSRHPLEINKSFNPNRKKLLTRPRNQDFIPPRANKIFIRQKSVNENSTRKLYGNQNFINRSSSRCNEKHNSFMLAFKSIHSGKISRRNSIIKTNTASERFSEPLELFSKPTIPNFSHNYVSLTFSRKSSTQNNRPFNEPINHSTKINPILTKRRKSLTVQQAILTASIY